MLSDVFYILHVFRNSTSRLSHLFYGPEKKLANYDHFGDLNRFKNEEIQCEEASKKKVVRVVFFVQSGLGLARLPESL